MYKQVSIDKVALYFDLPENRDVSLEDIYDMVEELNEHLSNCSGLSIENPQLILSEVTEDDVKIKLVRD